MILRRGWWYFLRSDLPVVVTGARWQEQKGLDKKGQLCLGVSWPGSATRKPHPKAAGSRRHLEEALISIPGGRENPCWYPESAFPSSIQTVSLQLSRFWLL